MKKMLYVNRPLLNGEDVVKWAKSVGFKTTLDPSEMHVTIAFSKEPVDWDQFEPAEKHLSIAGGKRSIRQFEGGATVLVFESELLHKRWEEFKDGGASYDFPEYHSHVTISYKAEDLDVSKVDPYMGALKFGAEEFKVPDLDWKNTIEEK